MAMPGKISAYQRLMLRIASVLPEKFRATFLHPAGTTVSKHLNFPKKKIFCKEKKLFHISGPTTVFFWAPTFKWGLVIAGIGDINRPADTISLSQTASLMITGAIWSRYEFYQLSI